MKKIGLYITIIGGIFILFSCTRSTDTISEDKSLAGLIRLIDGYRITEAQGSFDGSELENLQHGFFYIYKNSNNSIALSCNMTWGDGTSFTFSIPYIPISGERANVTFDYTSEEGQVGIWNQEILYNPISIYIAGWIKAEHPDTRADELNSITPMGLPTPAFLCDVDLECIMDGKELTIRITSIKS